MANDKQENKLDDALKAKLVKLCKNWQRRKNDPAAWQTTKDGRVQYHAEIVIPVFPNAHVYLVFQDKVPQAQAKLVLDPILTKLDEDNKDTKTDACVAFPYFVEERKLQDILDIKRTKEANGVKEADK